LSQIPVKQALPPTDCTVTGIVSLSMLPKSPTTVSVTMYTPGAE